jgi:glycosyltransferase involved in cell wall biosynthesis
VKRGRGGGPLHLLVICDTVGATQHISFAQPLADAIAGGEVLLDMVGHDAAWSSDDAVGDFWALYEPDVLILSRYTSGLADGLIRAARAQGTPVVFHIDDDLLNVPESLGASKFLHYNQPERLAALRGAMDASDFVYASTTVLAETLARNGIRSRIVSGEIYCSMEVEALVKPLPATGPVIGYMATGGHGADLELVLPAITRLMHEIPELRFETFGTIGAADDLAATFGSRVSHHRGVSPYDRFLGALRDLGWWIGIAPLEDTAFNRCKADTKWVEYTYAGLPTVASDLPVYRKACVPGSGLLAATEDDWYHALRGLVLDQFHRQALTAGARDHLTSRYSRERLRDQLLGVVEQALAPSPSARTMKRR